MAKSENPEVMRVSNAIQVEQRVFSLLQVLGHEDYAEHDEFYYFLDLYNVSEEDVEEHRAKYVKLINSRDAKAIKTQ